MPGRGQNGQGRGGRSRGGKGRGGRGGNTGASGKPGPKLLHKPSIASPKGAVIKLERSASGTLSDRFKQIHQATRPAKASTNQRRSQRVQDTKQRTKNKRLVAQQAARTKQTTTKAAQQLGIQSKRNNKKSNTIKAAKKQSIGGRVPGKAAKSKKAPPKQQKQQSKKPAKKQQKAKPKAPKAPKAPPVDKESLDKELEQWFKTAPKPPAMIL